MYSITSIVSVSGAKGWSGILGVKIAVETVEDLGRGGEEAVVDCMEGCNKERVVDSSFSFCSSVAMFISLKGGCTFSKSCRCFDIARVFLLSSCCNRTPAGLFLIPAWGFEGSEDPARDEGFECDEGFEHDEGFERNEGLEAG